MTYDRRESYIIIAIFCVMSSEVYVEVWLGILVSGMWYWVAG